MPSLVSGSVTDRGIAAQRAYIRDSGSHWSRYSSEEGICVSCRGDQHCCVTAGPGLAKTRFRCDEYGAFLSYRHAGHIIIDELLALLSLWRF